MATKKLDILKPMNEKEKDNNKHINSLKTVWHIYFE